jgi:EmrB/QacA subfamily drug resistance transporter
MAWITFQGSASTLYAAEMRLAVAERHAAPEKDWATSGAGHPRRWAILGVVVVSLLVVVLDNTVLNIALPTIQRDLNASQGELVWAIDSYILVFAALLFTWGVLGDKWGRKKVLVIGLVIFALASAACAFSASAGMLIGFRAIMGIGGAAVLPTTLAIITVVFPPHERGKAIGVWAGAVGAAVALGPVLGGVLLQHPDWTNWLLGNDWGSVFLINVPIVAVGLIGIWRVVPETRNPGARRLDIPGLLISFAGLSILIYGIIHASETRNWLDPWVVGPIIVGVAILAVFIVTEARSDHPSFDVSLFKNRGYAVSLTTVSLAFFALSGILFSLPFYLQILRGYDVLAAGLCFLPFAIGQLLAAPRSATMVQRFGYRPVMSTGLALVASALALLAFLSLDTPLWMVLTIFFLFGFGMGNVIAPASTVMQNVLPLERAGAGSAVQNTVRQVGGALGIAIVGTVLATQYARNLTDAVTNLGVPVPAEALDAASESIVATVGVLSQAPNLPEPVKNNLLSGAFDSFLAASHVTTWLSFVIVLVAFLAVLIALPQITPPQARPVTPKSPVDALVEEEVADYSQQLAQQVEDDATNPRATGS